jgi:pSer/pThr/pTyr-binding forkhead associated (FHA) protein
LVIRRIEKYGSSTPRFDKDFSDFISRINRAQRMAYIVLEFDAREIHRHELTGTITVGRSPECDVSVRDIQLSRRHCRIEQTIDGWAVEDLASKNGTFAHGRRIGRKRLTDHDELRIGRTQIRFFAGAFVEATKRAPTPRRTERPADPLEAMAGTVSAFEYIEQEAAVDSSGAEIPALAPRPRPADPRGYAREDLYSMLSSIASSSWDSIYATASRPIEREKLPAPRVKQQGARMREVMKQELHVMSLQAHPHAHPGEITPEPAKASPTKRQRPLWLACAVVWVAAAWMTIWELGIV